MKFKLDTISFFLLFSIFLPQYLTKHLQPRAIKFGISATNEKQQQIQSRIAATSILNNDNEEITTTRLPITAREKELYFAELALKSDQLLEWFSSELKEVCGIDCINNRNRVECCYFSPWKWLGINTDDNLSSVV